MARVLCSLPFAGERINDVAFEPAEGGMLSQEIGDEAAAAFCAIPGYRMAEGKAPPKETGTEGDGDDAALPQRKTTVKRKAD